MFQPGLDRGPLACEASVITTTLLKRDNNRGKIYEVILWQLFVAHLATVE